MTYKIINLTTKKKLTDKNLRKIRFNPFSGLLTDAKNVPLPNQDDYQISRYIGLNDASGTPICESDIVDLDGHSYIVIWEDSLCAFVLRDVSNANRFESFCDISAAKLTISGDLTEIDGE
jgi:hypothetical protein